MHKHRRCEASNQHECLIKIILPLHSKRRLVLRPGTGLLARLLREEDDLPREVLARVPSATLRTVPREYVDADRTSAVLAGCINAHAFGSGSDPKPT